MEKILRMADEYELTLKDNVWICSDDLLVNRNLAVARNGKSKAEEFFSSCQ
jgi:hypothetical protein